MTKKAALPLKRVHLWLYETDLDRIDIFFGHRLKQSEAIRTIIHDYLDRIEARVNATATPIGADLNVDAILGKSDQ